jgi:hypothetical protein
MPVNLIIVGSLIVGLFVGGVTGYIISSRPYGVRIEELEHQIYSKEDEIDKLNETLESIRDELADKNSTIMIYEETISSFEGRVKELEQRLKQYEVVATGKQKHGITYLSTNWHYEPSYPSDGEIIRDFQLFREQGITNITLVAIWKHIEPSYGVYNDAALDDIKRVCGFAEDHGLGVTIDFHTMMQEDSFTMPEWLSPRRFKTVIDNETNKRAWLNYLNHSVDYLKDEKAITSWHMMNEPARLEWGCNCTVDAFVDLWTEMRTIFKSLSTKPVSIRFGGDTFDTHFNRDPRILDICDYVSFNVYQTTNIALLADMVSYVHDNDRFVIISEYGLYTDDDTDQFYAYEDYLGFFDKLDVSCCVAWYWRADYDLGIPEGPGSGYNLAGTVDGDYRPAFKLIKLIP